MLILKFHENVNLSVTTPFLKKIIIIDSYYRSIAVAPTKFILDIVISGLPFHL